MMTKHCTLCKNDLPITEFNKNKAKKDGFQNVCRSCSRQRARKYHAENRDKHLKVNRENKKRYKARNRAMVNEAKAGGCVACGEKTLCCMDLHHLDSSTKEFNLAEIARGEITGMKRIERELAKCVCVCSNCHRKIHAGLLELA